VGQQISVKAADSIWRRFVATVKPGARSTGFPRLDPVVVAAARVVALRECPESFPYPLPQLWIFIPVFSRMVYQT